MISSRQSKNKRGCYERKSCFIILWSLTSPQQQHQSELQAEYLAQPSRNSVFKHFRSYPKVSTSVQQDVGRSSGCISFTSAGWFRGWTILPTAMQANPCRLKQTLTKCAKCVQSGKNTSPTMQAIQSLILSQTMSPDDSSLPVQAGFTRTFTSERVVVPVASVLVADQRIRSVATSPLVDGTQHANKRICPELLVARAPRTFGFLRLGASDVEPPQCIHPLSLVLKKFHPWLRMMIRVGHFPQGRGSLAHPLGLQGAYLSLHSVLCVARATAQLSLHSFASGFRRSLSKNMSVGSH